LASQALVVANTISDGFYEISRTGLGDGPDVEGQSIRPVKIAKLSLK